MYANKTYKRKRSNSYKAKTPYKKSKGYSLTKKREDLYGKATIQKSLIIDDRQMIKLKYVDTSSQELTVGIGNAISQTNIYNLNGLYDVNTAIASTAIPGFFEWGSFYLNYRVKGVKIECDALSETNGALIGVIMHAQPANATPTTFSNYLAIREFEGNQWTKKCTLGTLDGGGKSKMSMYIDLGKLAGPEFAYNTDTQTKGTFTTSLGSGSNPDFLSKLYITAYKMDGNIAGVTFNAAVLDLTFKFYIEAYGRIDVAT